MKHEAYRSMDIHDRYKDREHNSAGEYHKHGEEEHYIREIDHHMEPPHSYHTEQAGDGAVSWGNENPNPTESEDEQVLEQLKREEYYNWLHRPSHVRDKHDRTYSTYDHDKNQHETHHKPHTKQKDDKRGHDSTYENHHHGAEEHFYNKEMDQPADSHTDHHMDKPENGTTNWANEIIDTKENEKQQVLEQLRREEDHYNWRYKPSKDKHHRMHNAYDHDRNHKDHYSRPNKHYSHWRHDDAKREPDQIILENKEYTTIYDDQDPLYSLEDYYTGNEVYVSQRDQLKSGQNLETESTSHNSRNPPQHRVADHHDHHESHCDHDLHKLHRDSPHEKETNNVQDYEER